MKPAIGRCGMWAKEVEAGNADKPVAEWLDFQGYGATRLSCPFHITATAEQSFEKPLHAAAFNEFWSSAMASITSSNRGGSPKIIPLIA